MSHKIITIVGARPQFIKAASVSRAIQAHNRTTGRRPIREIIVHTGQHYDHNMSRVFFDELEIPEPQYNLGVGSGSHGEMTGAMLAPIERVLLDERPDWVLVYGDTNSTLAGALAAVKLHIPVAHVEAGLRSFNRRMPEEINRVLTDHVALLLCCPTHLAMENLAAEGIADHDHLDAPVRKSNSIRRRVRLTGDVMYDAFLFYRDLARKKSDIIGRMGLTPDRYCLATVHRAENTDDAARLKAITASFAAVAQPSCPLVVPLHPRTQKILSEIDPKIRQNRDVRIIEPVGYLDMIALEADARAILTDSGGVQKEAYFANVPCITFRDETEWVETVDAGWNFISGSDATKIIEHYTRVIASPPSDHPDLYGDGRASWHVLDGLAD